MKKILLTESQAKLLFEEIEKNDTIQKLIFCEPSDITFDITDELSDGKHLGGDLFRITPVVGGKRIGSDYLSLLGEKVGLDDGDYFQLYINVNPDIRRLGIANKLYTSFINQGNSICSLFKNVVEDNPKEHAISNLWKKISTTPEINVEEIVDEEGNVIGLSASKSQKSIYLSEKQYQYIDKALNEEILKELGSLLNESVLDESRISKVLYRGCRTFQDYARRTLLALTGGMLAASLLITIVANNTPLSDSEKSSIIERIEEIEEEKENSMLNKNYATNFTISEDGIEHIKQYEKCVLKPYYATKSEKQRGILTIGWGHKITKNDPEWLRKAKSITQEQADLLFNNDIKVYEKELKEAFKSLPKSLQNPTLYPQGTMDVCISMIYNCGRGNLKTSPFFQTLANCRIDKDTNKIDERDFYYACSKIRESCITQQGVVSQGLVNRRNTECLMAQS